jgi:kynurenine formamidase
MRLLDLSHTIEENMTVLKSFPKPRIEAFFDCEQFMAFYRGVGFEVTRVDMVTRLGTYMDSPFHRWSEGRDVAQLRLEEVILPGLIVDASKRRAGKAIPPEVLPDMDFIGKAVLFYTGWDRFWKQEEYYHHPFLSGDTGELLRQGRPGLVGIDALSLDNAVDHRRPAHTLLLKDDILIVENLTGLGQLLEREFTLFAVPVKVRGAASFPVRAFAFMD